MTRSRIPLFPAPTRRLACCAALSLAVLAAGETRAQVGPEQTVRKIMDEVSKEMQEIDRLLLESSRAKDAAQRAEQNVDHLRDLMDKTQSSQDKVVRGIDKLIDELQNMAKQSQSSSSSSQQDQQDQQQQQGGEPKDREGQQNQQQGQQGQRSREEIQTPDVARQDRPEGQQPGEQPKGEQQGQQPQGQRPQGGERDPKDPGANTRAGAPTEDGSEHVDRATDAERWGDLQKYVPPQYQRGGVPEVPAKYRRLHEAFQKRTGKTGTGGDSGGR